MPNTVRTSPTPGTEPSSATVEAQAWFTVGSVSFRYGAAPVIRDLSFTLGKGGFLTLLGPSGCGKTTLLKLIGGYLIPSAGRIGLKGREISRLPPEKRNTGMVFQNYALFPHLSARRNVSFGLEVRGVSRAICQDRADAILERVGIAPAERDRRPAHLSGGQQQRVALARALIIQPDLLLLDEPFANLDRHLREQLRSELRRLQQETGVTTVMVTHDQEEALAVSDWIGVMNNGRLLQFGTPREVYDRPRTAFVARFLGDANLIDGVLFGHPLGSVVMVRPERCVVGLDAALHRRRWSAQVRSRAFLGPDVVVELESPNRPTIRARYRPVAPHDRRPQLDVGIPDDAAWLIPEADATP
jgi:ABC-type Fe3+/spermidine/putrescine transport system ATPase subunit